MSTPDQKKRYKRATIATAGISSTPIKDVSLKHLSISLSGIDTASSSSADKEKLRLWKSQILKKRKKNLKNMKSANKKSRTVIQSKDINDDWKIKSTHVSLTEKQKKNPSNKKRADKRKRKVAQSKNTDDEWVTELEESINKSIHSRESIQKERDDYSQSIQLFNTPEKIRDAGYMESVYPSPILPRRSKPKRSMKRIVEENLISSKDNIVRQDKSKLRNLPSVSSEVRNLEGTDEDDIRLNRVRSPKTYLPARKKSRTSEKNLEQEPEDFVFPDQFPKVFRDMFSDQFVEKSHDEIHRYSAPFTVRIESTSEEVPVFQKSVNIPPIPPETVCFLGHSSRSSRKWIKYTVSCSSKQEEERNERKAKTRKRINRKQEEKIVKRKQRKKTVKRKFISFFSPEEAKTLQLPCNYRGNTVYDQPDKIDIEFETGGRDGKRMSLSEFRRKRM